MLYQVIPLRLNLETLKIRNDIPIMIAKPPFYHDLNPPINDAVDRIINSLSRVSIDSYCKKMWL